MNIRTVLLMTGIVALSSCYEDQGNYSYRFDSMNSIDTLIFTPGTVEALSGKLIEFTQPLTAAETHKKIQVEVKQSKQTGLENLDFTWIEGHKKNGKTVYDTLTTRGYLDVDLPLGRDTSFTVLLRVHDQSTKLSRYANFQVATRPIFKNSLFFLHGSQGNVRLGNVEVVGASTKVRSDAYKLVHPDAVNPFTKAYKLMFQYGLVSERRDFVKRYNLIAFETDGKVKTYDPFGLKPCFTNYRDFVVPQSDQGTFLPSKIGMVGDPSNQSDFYYMLGRDGRFITARTIPSFKFPATASSVTNYNVTAAAITAADFVFWDSRSNRFLHVNKEDSYGIWAERQAYEAQLNNPVLDAHVDFSSLAAGLSPVGKKGIYGFIQFRENYNKAQPYFIFSDAAGTKYYLYQLTSTATDEDGGGNANSNEPAYTIKGKQLTGFTPSSTATICYNTWFTTNYVFYADGSDVMRFDLNNGDKTVLYSAPTGYTISCMKFCSDDNFLYSGDLGRYMVIGMNRGTEGGVAQIKLNTASDIDETYAPRFYDQDENGQRLGNILDVQFVREYSYQIPIRK